MSYHGDESRRERLEEDRLREATIAPWREEIALLRQKLERTQLALEARTAERNALRLKLDDAMDIILERKK